MLNAYVMVACGGRNNPEIGRVLRGIPGIVEVHPVYGCDRGDHAYMARVEAEDNRGLDRIIIEGIQGIPDAVATRTWLVVGEDEPYTEPTLKTKESSSCP